MRSPSWVPSPWHIRVCQHLSSKVLPPIPSPTKYSRYGVTRAEYMVIASLLLHSLFLLMQPNLNEPPQDYWLMLILQSTNNPECFTCAAVKPDFIYSVLAQLVLRIQVKDVCLRLVRMSSFQPIEVPSDLTLSSDISYSLQLQFRCIVNQFHKGPHLCIFILSSYDIYNLIFNCILLLPSNYFISVNPVF